MAAPGPDAPPAASRETLGPTREELQAAAAAVAQTPPLLRGLLMAAGSLCLLLGLLGLFLPLLPTTPFMLLAAACYARASLGFYRWLTGHPLFGPPILEWRRHRAIPYRAKRAGVLLMALTFGSSILLVVREPWLQAGLACCGLALCLWLWRLPSRDGP